MNGVKVSCVIAAYKVAAFIGQCARSLFSQTLADMEFVFVDDASPDDGMGIVREVLEAFPARKEQVKIVRHERNQGIIQTRRDGLAEATGDYILFVDGDDWMEPDLAENLYNKAVETEADMVVCDFYVNEGANQYQSPAFRDEALERGDDYRKAIINRMAGPYVWNKLIRRSLLTKNGFVWPVRPHGEDIVIITSAAYYSRTIAYVERPLNHYRINPQSMMNRIDENHLVRMYEDYKQNMMAIEDFLERQGCGEEYAEGIYSNKLRTKNNLLPLVGERKYWRLWKNTFPEINKTLFWGNKSHKSSYRDKIWYLCIVTGLYPRMRKFLVKKIFRTGQDWKIGAYKFDHLYKASKLRGKAQQVA